MPTIQYPKNPNVETAFVEQDDGSKNRVVLTAPQDISTIEYPNNPNSTKAYITVNGKKQRVVMTADISGSGSSLPDQTGHSGEFLTTDGTDASWAAVDSLPSQTGNAGKFLTTDGTDASWSDNLTKVNTTITIAVADWNGGTTVTKTVAGITSTGVVFVSPDPTDQADYTSAGIICTAQATDSLTFSCSTTPTNDIDVVVVML